MKLPKLKKFSLPLLISISIILVILNASTFAFITYQNTQDGSKNLPVSEYTENEDNVEQNEEQSSDSNDSTQEDTPEENEENSNNQSNTQTEDSTSTQDEKEEESTQTSTPDPEPEPEPQPQPESPSIVVAFYADNQSDTDVEDLNHQRVVNNILATGANPVFHAGDLMEDGTQDSLDRFNNVTSTLRATRIFYSAIGNNDRKVGDSSTPSQLYLDNFTYPNNELWYSVNYSNLHMVILDSAFNASNSSQLSWLANDLQSSNSQERITGVMFHHPTFINTISSYLVDYGVDFVVAGHIHSYTHSTHNGIDFITMSGQPNIGYMICKIYSSSVKMYVYNNGNGLIDTIEFNER